MLMDGIGEKVEVKSFGMAGIPLWWSHISLSSGMRVLKKYKPHFLRDNEKQFLQQTFYHVAATQG